MTVTNVGYSTSVFLFTQRQLVVLLYGNSPRAYMPNYAKTLMLHKGVDNKIQFQFLNQEQKKVDITGKTITCRILNYEGNKILITKALTLELPATGLAYLYLNAADLEDIDAQKCYYTLEIPEGQFDFPVFVDPSAGARGDVNIVNSILPSFVPSQIVTIPTGQPFPNLSPNGSIPNANTYYSSYINTQNNPVISIQAKYTDYNGNVVIQGTTNQQGTDWYNIQTFEYDELTDTKGYTVHGFHPYMRLCFSSNAGVVTNILAR